MTHSDGVVVFFLSRDEKGECVGRQFDLGPLLPPFPDTETDEDVALVGLPMKLILNRVQAAVLSGMVKAVVFGGLIRRFQRLLSEKAERKSGEWNRLPAMDEEVMESRWHVVPRVLLDPQLRRS